MGFYKLKKLNLIIQNSLNVFRPLVSSSSVLSFSSLNLLSLKYCTCFKSVKYNSSYLNNLNKKYIAKYSKVELGQCKRCFSTTNVNKAPAIIWVLIRPFTKVLALIMGRSLRKWYQSLPPDKKQLTIKWFKRNYIKLILISLGFVGFFFGFYKTHLQETPITKRQRFMIFTDKQYKSIANYGFKASFELFKDKILPKQHFVCKRVEKITRRILESNQDIKEIYDKAWSLVVVDAPEIRNAFVTSNGQIFVFSGMLNICSNDDQLGNVLAHEMSHAILGHSAEILSHATFIDIFIMIIIGMIWALIPLDVVAAAVHVIFYKLVQIGLELPYNRKLETEADEIGLFMASKACLDVRESVAFWKKMALIEVLELDLFPNTEMPKEIDFLLTHPSHESRAQHLDSLLPNAIKLRESCNCPKLPLLDPRAILDEKIRLLKKQSKLNDQVTVIHISRPT